MNGVVKYHLIILIFGIGNILHRTHLLVDHNPLHMNYVVRYESLDHV